MVKTLYKVCTPNMQEAHGTWLTGFDFTQEGRKVGSPPSPPGNIRAHADYRTRAAEHAE